jgi:hypothetical protein
MDEEIREGRRFEFFKHMTTLNSAAVVATVAISSEFSIERTLFFIALSAFAISLVIALEGMFNGMEATLFFGVGFLIPRLARKIGSHFLKRKSEHDQVRRAWEKSMKESERMARRILREGVFTLCASVFLLGIMALVAGTIDSSNVSPA